MEEGEFRAEETEVLRHGCRMGALIDKQVQFMSLLEGGKEIIFDSQHNSSTSG